MKSRRIAALLIAGAALLFARPCVAAPLEAVPEDALAVVRFRQPQAAVKKTLKVAGRLDPNYETLLTVMTAQIGVLISNPKLEGIDPKGDWWLVVFPSEGSAPPAVAFGIPFTDEQKLKTATTGTHFTFIKHEKYLFYSDDSRAAQKIESRVKDEGKSIISQIDRASQAVMNRSDLSMYVNLKQVNEHYKALLDIAAEEIDKGVKDWKSMIITDEKLDLGPVFGMYGEMGHKALQAVRDTEGYTIGIEASLRGANIEQYVHLTAGSATDTFLQTQVPSEIKELEQMPPDKLVYAALTGDFTALTQWSMKFAGAMIQDEEDKKAMQDAMSSLEKLKYTGYLLSFGLGSTDEGAIQMTTVVKAEPTDILKDVTRKSSALMQKMSVGATNQKIEVELKPDAEKYGRYSADVLNVKMEMEKPANAPPGVQEQMDKMMEGMYGPDGMTQRMVYTGDRMIQTLGGGKDTMEQALKALDATHSADSKSSPLLQTRAALAEKANFLFFIDLPSLVTRAATLMLDGAAKIGNVTMAIPVDVEALKTLDIKPSYIGTSLTVGTASIATKTFIPIEQAENIDKLIGLFTSAMAGQAPEKP